MQYSRSLGNEALRMFKEFREELSKWKQWEYKATLLFQTWSKNVKTTPTAEAHARPKQSKQLLPANQPALPDVGWHGSGGKGTNLVYFTKNQVKQWDERENIVSWESETKWDGRTQNTEQKMPGRVWFTPRTSSGIDTFEWKVEFDMSMSRSILSEDLEVFFGITKILQLPGLVGLMDAHGHDLSWSPSACNSENKRLPLRGGSRRR